MRIVTANEMHVWLSQGEVLEKDSQGPKVIRLTTGQLLKIFRSRRRPFLARLSPEAERFAQHAKALQERGVATPHIEECCWLNRHQAVSACLYKPLPGTSLEHLFKYARQEFDCLLPALAHFIKQLHIKGIYFRSLHLGNIIYKNGSFGLIDFLDIRFRPRPLSRSLIKRNFNHLENYLIRRKVQDFPLQALIEYYDHANA
ncbi:lipopolysaccharide kinase (Kdo/WaaP) family protein [Pseudomonas duriflava]|uniref:Lipopolysaccharide kinase (Kdo/WaaP) family protein n=1 Tax=Pseudomonas duriflava TaxID=459528 RepID=A0A562QBX0_9PSED|nr:lipopolysaccharide kinase InaA family protein [Pseudomonas duriflava]TWI54209.1 lipopolysaccharide kinase (Kdo/WaaP) family protein [Pseudomonas duriflava]